MTTPTDQQRLIHALWQWITAVAWKETGNYKDWIPADLHAELGNTIITVDDWNQTQP